MLCFLKSWCLMAKNNTKMKFLVTGASGFIGYEVARQLSVNGYRPRLMIRQAGDDCEICNFNADFVLADLRNPESLRQAVKGIDGILHLAARATFESYDTLKPSILDGSLALMRAGIEAGVRRFVYSSSLLVYRGNPSIVTVDTEVNPVLDYGRIKVETEKRLSEIAKSAGIAFAALRLPHVYGVRDLYFRQLQAGRLILPGLGKTSLHTPSRCRCGFSDDCLCRAGLPGHRPNRRPPSVLMGHLHRCCQTTLPKCSRLFSPPMVGSSRNVSADTVSQDSSLPRVGNTRGSAHLQFQSRC
jgi:uncharacterized protein YbjT (DUF2867 family)